MRLVFVALFILSSYPSKTYASKSSACSLFTKGVLYTSSVVEAVGLRTGSFKGVFYAWKKLGGAIISSNEFMLSSEGSNYDRFKKVVDYEKVLMRTRAKAVSNTLIILDLIDKLERRVPLSKHEQTFISSLDTVSHSHSLYFIRGNDFEASRALFRLFALKSNSVFLDHDHLGKKPKPQKQFGFFYRTNNQTGYMQERNDIYSQHAIDLLDPEDVFLDVGTAYGVAALAALGKGAKVIASDIDLDHLRVVNHEVPDHLRERIEFLHGGLPSNLKLASGSVNVILVSRVFHFLTGEQIEQSVAALFDLLKPGGLIIATAETPFLSAAQKAQVLAGYEEKKAAGDPWPGFTTEVQKIYPTLKEGLPPHMNYMDPDIFRRVFERAGFEVIKTDTFARPEFPREAQLDGRESVGVIARKPQ